MHRIRVPFTVLLGIALSLATSTALAQKTWTGTTSGNWTAGSNWSPSGSPGAGVNVTFDGTGSNLNTSFNGTSYSLNSLTFTANQTSPVTITTTNANPLTLSATGTKLTVAAGNHTFYGTKDDTSGAPGDWIFSGNNQEFTLNIAGNASFQIDGKITNTNNNQRFVKTGTGTLILSANNGGATPAWNFQNSSTGSAISQGAVRFAVTNATGNSQNDYTVANGAAFEITGNSTLLLTVGNVTLNGTGIGNTGAMRSTGGNNTFSAAASATGTIVLGAASSIGVDADTLTVGKGISGSNSLTKVGAGTLVLGRAAAINNNTYSGATLVDAGTLQFAITGALYNGNSGNWTAANLNAKAGTTLAFNVGGSSEFTAGNVTTLLSNLATSSSTTHGMNAGSSLGFDTTNAGGSFTIADVIADTTGSPSAGARGLTKLGNGTLVLSNTNTYTGPTRVSGGTLALDASGSIANSALIDVQSNATLDVSAVSGGLTLANGQDLSLASTGTILGNLNVANGTTFVIGAGSGLKTIAGDLDFGATSTWDVSSVIAGGSGITNDDTLYSITFGSGFGVGNLLGVDENTPIGEYTLIHTDQNFGPSDIGNWETGTHYVLGGGKSAFFKNGSLVLVVVPEPSVLLLAAVGIGGVGYAACRRRRR
jgi:autotransporter-associated beta strand protein